MRKEYFKPAMRVVEIKQRQILCGSGSEPYHVKSLSTNLDEGDGFDYVGGGNGQGR